MGKFHTRLAQILCAGIALLITAHLYNSKLPPFSLVVAQDEMTTDAGVVSELSEPAVEGGTLIVVSESFDQMIEMKDGVNTWTKTITLINAAAEPVKIYFFGSGLKVCAEADSKNCIQFPSQITVEANESLPVDIVFSEISLDDHTSVDGQLLLAGGGLQKEIPFSIRGAWQKAPTDFPGMTSRSITSGMTWLLAGFVFFLL